MTAAVTGGIGIVALTRVNEARQVPLALTPLLFALQQAIEGLLWLSLPLVPGESISGGLTTLYLFFAQVFWPIYSPAAVLLIEPAGGRRLLMLACLAVGVAVGGYLLGPILMQPHGAAIVNGHIVYVTEHRRSDLLALSYLAATTLPLVLSSHRTVVALGAVVLVGSSVAYALYWEAFASVWCFFAAAASGVILWHFDSARRKRLRVVSF